VIFHSTYLEGAYIIEPEKRSDDRGFFARTFCRKEMDKYGLVSEIVQTNISCSRTKGTLRGMHYQRAPHQETKLIRCTKGALYDVIIDLRANSPTYKRWFGVELTATNYKMLYIPGDFAHGFLTLEDDTEVVYEVSEFYTPQAEGGVRWNDPVFNITWPNNINKISEKDSSWPDFT
jgi:dTDP-4-dehydrorhamnose 3,5-epimerase